MVATQGSSPELIQAEASAALWALMFFLVAHALVTLYKEEVNAAGAHLAVVSLDNGTVTDLGVRGSNPHYAEPGFVVFHRNREALVAPFSLRKRAITGEASRLTDRVGSSTTGRADLAVSQNGVFAYRPFEAEGATGMFIVDAKGSERPIVATAGVGVEPRIAPDGRHVVTRDQAEAATAGDLWVHELETGAATRLTSNGQSWRPEWTTDGRRIAYLSGTDVGSSLVTRPWDGNGEEVVLVSSQATGPRRILQSLSLGPSRTFAAIRTGSRATSQSADIWIAPGDSLSSMRPLFTSPFYELEPAVSPDGQLLAFTSNQSGRFEVYVTTLPGPGPRVVVSLDGGTEPAWSPNGTSVLFYRGPTRMMSAAVTRTPTLAISRRDSLFVDTYRRYTGFAAYDVFPDGNRFLMTRELDGAARRRYRTVIIVNWPAMLRAGRSAEQ